MATRATQRILAQIREDEVIDEEPLVEVDVPDGRVLPTVRLPRVVLECDLFVNVPKLKTKEVEQRARAAHVTIQRGVVELTAEAIRVCGGRAMLKRYPLERYSRDARAAALMRPWTQDIAIQQAWEAELGIGPAARPGAGAS